MGRNLNHYGGEMDKKCMYCCADLTHTNYPYFVVRESVKPRYNYGRWKAIGYCCDDCEASGKSCVIETVK